MTGRHVAGAKDEVPTTTTDARDSVPEADSPEIAKDAQPPAAGVVGPFVVLGDPGAEACGPDGCAHT